MGIAQFGPNRMVTFAKPEEYRNRNLTESRPEWGLGPRGMPGSSDYLAEQKRREQRGEGPNPFEQMGLYWTGSGITQGRPLRDIQIDQGIAPQKMAQGDRQLDLQAQEQAQRAGAEQTRLGLMGSEQDLSRAKLAGDQANDQARLGLMGSEQDLSRAKLASDQANEKARLGLMGTEQDIQRGRLANDLKLGLMGAQAQATHANTAAVGTLAGIAPGGQEAAARLLGIAPPSAPIINAAQMRAEDRKLPAPLEKDPALANAVARALAVDPKGTMADDEYYRIGIEAGLQPSSMIDKNAGKWFALDTDTDVLKRDAMIAQVKSLMKTYRPQVQQAGGLVPEAAAGAAEDQADGAAPVAGAAAEAPAVSDAFLNEYTKLYPRVRSMPREELRAMLAKHLASQSKQPTNQPKR
jgi:hypothetical protein